MRLVAAVDRNWAIGNKGQLLVSIPSDQKFFRDETLGKVIVMGRKTFESLPGQQALYGRTNIVLTRDPSWTAKDVIVCHSLEETLRELQEYASDDIFIIGGQSIYDQFLPYCDCATITWVDYEYEADTWFPNLDQEEAWYLAEASDEQTYFNLCFEFRGYRRVNK